MTELTFTVPGTPVPKERARTVKSRGRTRSFTPKRTATYETLVGLHAMMAAAEWRLANGRGWDATGRYAVSILVHRATAIRCDLTNVDAHSPRVVVTVRRVVGSVATKESKARSPRKAATKS